MRQFARENSLCLKRDGITLYPDPAFRLVTREGQAFPLSLATIVAGQCGPATATLRSLARNDHAALVGRDRRPLGLGMPRLPAAALLRPRQLGMRMLRAEREREFSGVFFSLATSARSSTI